MGRKESVCERGEKCEEVITRENETEKDKEEREREREDGEGRGGGEAPSSGLLTR